MPALAAPGTASRPPWGTEVLPRRPAGRCQAPAAPNPQFWGVQLIPVAQASPRPLVTSRGGENAQGVNQGGWLTKTTASIEADLPFFFLYEAAHECIAKAAPSRGASRSQPHTSSLGHVTGSRRGLGRTGPQSPPHSHPAASQQPGVVPPLLAGSGFGGPLRHGEFCSRFCFWGKRPAPRLLLLLIFVPWRKQLCSKGLSAFAADL